MASQRNVTDARSIMTGFADRTGLLNNSVTPQRYLWTDAFAVCALLSIHTATGDDQFMNLAIRLIDQVHYTLGQHRPDGPQEGWISGLDKLDGRLHPTIGGLRIGKPLSERGPSEAYDEAREWNRDGQYFHYLTRWMHALERAAVVTGDPTYCRWALELARTAHGAFTHRPGEGFGPRLYWKMSVDLSRPLVPSMGHHDPLDAFVTYNELENCRRTHFDSHAMPELTDQIQDAAEMCRGRNWATEDPLGLGGLLIDAHRIGQLQTLSAAQSAAMLEQILADAGAGLRQFAARYPLRGAADSRLAFRELGLSIGLHALEALRASGERESSAIRQALGAQLPGLVPFGVLAEQIETFWRQPASQAASSWLDHRDINAVMLAASLLPEQSLLA